MSTAVGPRERALFSRSLAPVLLGLCGHCAIVELKNEFQVAGKITAVDCFTNITMEKAVMTKLTGAKSVFDMFFIPMRSIRAVQIPDFIAVPEMLKDQLDVITGVKQRQERKKAKLRQQKLRQNKLERQNAKEAKQKALDDALKQRDKS